MNAPEAQILVSKYHFLLQDFSRSTWRDGARKVQRMSESEGLIISESKEVQNTLETCQKHIRTSLE